MPANFTGEFECCWYAPGTEFQCESNSVQQHWQPQGREERKSHGLDGDISDYHLFKAADKNKMYETQNWANHQSSTVRRLCRHGIDIRTPSPKKCCWAFRTIKEQYKYWRAVLRSKFLPADIRKNINYPGIVRSSKRGGEVWAIW